MAFLRFLHLLHGWFDLLACVLGWTAPALFVVTKGSGCLPAHFAPSVVGATEGRQV